MAVFNLTFRTLAGQQYRIPVKSTMSIQDMKMKLRDKISRDTSHPIHKNILNNATIRLTVMKNDNYIELMDTNNVSDYPQLSENPIISIAIDTPLFKVHVVENDNAYETDIYIKPEDTIFNVKEKIYGKLLDHPFYKTYGSAMFNIKHNNRLLLQLSLTISQYPAITAGSTLNIVMDDEQFYTDIRTMVGKYQMDILQEKVPFNYLMTGSELRSLLTSPEINPSKEYILRIGRENGAIIEDDAYLFQYPTMEYDSNLYLSYVKNNSNSNSNSNSNRNSIYSNWGGRRMTKRKSRSNRKSRRGRKLH